ncbi:MAG: hypothetical protein AAB470_02815 [Patescibacteria group bacterium]
MLNHSTTSPPVLQFWHKNGRLSKKILAFATDFGYHLIHTGEMAEWFKAAVY